MAEVAERFRRDHIAVRLKASSARRLQSVIRWHILPAFGNRPMVSNHRKDVLELHQRMSGTPNQANRMLRTLSLMYTLARDWDLLPAGLRPAGHNPCTGVMKYPECTSSKPFGQKGPGFKRVPVSSGFLQATSC